jgi:hypothetical protein
MRRKPINREGKMIVEFVYKALPKYILESPFLLLNIFYLAFGKL